LQCISSTTDGTINYLTATYYDSYNYPGVVSFSTQSGFLSTNQLISGTTGLVTGSATSLLNSSTGLTTWQITSTYYDNYVRKAITITSNHMGGTTSESYAYYGITGQITNKITQQSINGGSPVSVEQIYALDPAGRIVKEMQTIGTSFTTISQSTYNPIGQLQTKQLHQFSDGTFMQTINYLYNIRGWLTSINNPNDLVNANQNAFSLNLYYNDVSALGGLTSSITPQYNGNIAGMVWQNNNISTTVKGYGFGYDNKSRLLNAYYGEGTALASNSDAYDESGISYDANGNIQTLNRNQIGVLIDNLGYTYNRNSNQLLKVYDSSANPLGFSNGSNGKNNAYTYDNNGNLNADANKNITSITYNLINLPQTVNYGNGNSLNYIYNASGEKLRNDVTQNSTTTSHYYLNGFEYDNTMSLIQFTFSEGVVSYDGTNYTYQYYLKDHLGNTRAVLQPNFGGSPQYTVLQSNDYYPFGMPLNLNFGTTNSKYLYNGKEYLDELGLVLYDYGNRFYDPQIGRWGVIDKKAELYFNWSPYNYALNTPLNAIDPDGHLVIFVNGFTPHPSEQGTSNYWRTEVHETSYERMNLGDGGSYIVPIDNLVSKSFDTEVMSKFNDGKPKYFDGSLHGVRGNFKNYLRGGNMNPEVRFEAGLNISEGEIEKIIQSIKNADGVIVESIKVVTHSMGAAYGKGLITAILKYAKEHPELCEGLSITEYDFAAFQQNNLSAIPGVPLHQYDNEGDGVVDGVYGNTHGSKHAKQEGASSYNSDCNSSGGHSIFDFDNQIKNLPAGKYKIVNGQIVPY
jgi:RHS repeat-associated protein